MTPNRVESGEIFQTTFLLFPIFSLFEPQFRLRIHPKLVNCIKNTLYLQLILKNWDQNDWAGELNNITHEDQLIQFLYKF